METHSNKILVGFAVGALLLMLVLFVLWLARPERDDEANYQILFAKSVQGLEPGSPVTLGGVPVGYVSSISLVPENPERVRVVIRLPDTIARVPRLRADLTSSLFTGAAHVTLEQAGEGASNAGAFVDARGVRNIPAEAPSRGVLSGSPGEMLGSVSRTVDRLNDSLAPQRRPEIEAAFEETRAGTAKLAADARNLSGPVSRLPTQLRKMTRTAARAGKAAERWDRTIQTTGSVRMQDIRTSLREARQSLSEFDRNVENAGFSIREATSSVPRATQNVRQLRSNVAQVSEAVKRIDQQGLGTGDELPSYNNRDSQTVSCGSEAGGHTATMTGFNSACPGVRAE